MKKLDSFLNVLSDVRVENREFKFIGILARTILIEQNHQIKENISKSYLIQKQK